MDSLPRSVPALLRERLRTSGPQPLLTFCDDATGERTELSYATLGNWAAKTANMLTEELGVGRGSRVALELGPHWAAPAIALGTWQVGAALADDGEVRFAEEDAPDADAVLVGRGLGGRLAAQPPGGVLGYAEDVLAFADDYDDPDVADTDDALLAAGVRLTQRNLLAAAAAFMDWGVNAADRVLVMRPPASVDGLAFGLLGPLLAGGAAVVVHRPDPQRWWRHVAEERATVALVGGADLAGLPPAPPDTPLRAVVCLDGAPRTDLGVPVCSGWALPQAACAAALVPQQVDSVVQAWLGETSATTVGTATSWADIAVLDAAGDALAEGDRGELCVRGPVVTPAAGGDWLRTGDEGYWQTGPDGRPWLFLTGVVVRPQTTVAAMT